MGLPVIPRHGARMTGRSATSICIVQMAYAGTRFIIGEYAAKVKWELDATQMRLSFE